MKTNFFKKLEKLNLIFEELDFNINKDFKYKNKNICVIPGSFKPPHKGHFEMVLECTKVAELTFIFISNTSEKYISERYLSITNLNKFAKIISKFELPKNLKKEYDELILNADTLSYNDLNRFFETLKGHESEVDEKLITNLTKFMDSLQSKLFASIRRTSNGTEITPEVAKEIFEIFIKAHGLENKVFVQISQSSSPMKDIIRFANNECKDCNIYLGRSTKNEDFKAFDSMLQAFDENPSNVIIPFPINVKTQISATDLRRNINNLTKDMFTEKISNKDFEQIRTLLV
jgi:nicotinamide mononucleotide adenylyltransferase